MGSQAKKQLQPYIGLAEFLAHCYGENVEVVVHDISDLDRSAIAIFNNHVSGRKMGAPMPAHMLKTIRERKYRDKHYSVNTKNVLSNGRALRSSTYFIKDEAGELIGTMCINIDVSQYVELGRLFEKMAFGACAAAPEAEPADSREIFPETVDDLIDNTIADFEGEDGDVSGFTPERKIEIVSQLNGKGIFMLKGTVKKVAAALGVSEPTVYRYLSIANHSENHN